MKHYNDIMDKGGTWLGNLRSRIQTMFINGDTVTTIASRKPLALAMGMNASNLYLEK